MAKRYHVTENGPKRCEARRRVCPVGGAHFTSKDEAERAYSFTATTKFNIFWRAEER